MAVVVDDVVAASAVVVEDSVIDDSSEFEVDVDDALLHPARRSALKARAMSSERHCIEIESNGDRRADSWARLRRELSPQFDERCEQERPGELAGKLASSREWFKQLPSRATLTRGKC